MLLSVAPCAKEIMLELSNAGSGSLIRAAYPCCRRPIYWLLGVGYCIAGIFFESDDLKQHTF